jgi:hypothetical protein
LTVANETGSIRSSLLRVERALVIVVLVAAAVVAPAPAAPWLFKATAIDLAFGPNFNHFLDRNDDRPALLDLEVLHIAVGRFLRPRLGAALGISLMRGEPLDLVDPLPVSAYLFYDISAARARIRTYTYGRLSFSHSAEEGFDVSKRTGPYFTAELGISPVLLVVTPYAELSYRTYRNRFQFRVGAALGGGPFVRGRRDGR